MRRTPFVIAIGFAGILAVAVATASAQDRSGGDAAPGSGGARAAAAPQGNVSVRGGGVSHGVYAGPRYYAPVRFLSPYYVFRSHFSVGSGVFIGYPIAYSYSYYYPEYFYPYAYPYPYPYGRTYLAPGPTYYQAPAGLDQQYPPQSQKSVGVQPGPTEALAGLDPIGGLSFEITPSDARVIVDGYDVGSVGQFTPASRALGLPAGRHHIEIVANGYRTMSSDVDLRAGQVIPFQGQMER
jgi:hypothetical protein